MLRAKELAYGVINCLGRHTITGLLACRGKLFEDWSGDYRLFQQDRMKVDRLFDVVRKEIVINELDPDRAIYAHMDDTLTRKTGKKIVGTSWRRDPLGPPFHTNFIWGQRFIQTSISLPLGQGPCSSLSIPVDFFHSPTANRPGKGADQKAWDDYKEQQKQTKLSLKGVERIKLLRTKLDEDGASARQLVVSVDGSYTNQTVLKNLPERTTLIGRIRKDTVLNQLPDQSIKGVGRNRVYGQALPSPEQIRQSQDYPWQQVEGYATGKKHQFYVKVVGHIRWRKAGKQNLQLVIIRPLSYRLTKNSRLLYRKPVYLICTDPEMNINELLQAYLRRWGIEVNFRDQKTLLGCGQAQVRTKTAVEKAPAFITLVYAMLLLAHHQAHKNQHSSLPRAKWYPQKTKNNTQTTGDIINYFRSQIIAKHKGINFDHFINTQRSIKIYKNRPPVEIAALVYARN